MQMKCVNFISVSLLFCFINNMGKFFPPQAVNKKKTTPIVLI